MIERVKIGYEQARPIVARIAAKALIFLLIAALLVIEGMLPRWVSDAIREALLGEAC